MNLVKRVFNFVDGYKTYAVGLAMVVVGVYKKDQNLFFQGLALLGIRNAMAKMVPTA